MTLHCKTEVLSTSHVLMLFLKRNFFRSESLEFHAYHFQLAPIFRCHQSAGRPERASLTLKLFSQNFLNHLICSLFISFIALLNLLSFFLHWRKKRKDKCNRGQFLIAYRGSAGGRLFLNLYKSYLNWPDLFSAIAFPICAWFEAFRVKAKQEERMKEFI